MNNYKVLKYALKVLVPLLSLSNIQELSFIIAVNSFDISISFEILSINELSSIQRYYQPSLMYNHFCISYKLSQIIYKVIKYSLCLC